MKAPQAFADQLKAEKYTVKDYLQLGEVLGRLRLATNFTDEQNLRIASMMIQAVGLKPPVAQTRPDSQGVAFRPGPKPRPVFMEKKAGKFEIRLTRNGGTSTPVLEGPKSKGTRKGRFLVKTAEGTTLSIFEAVAQVTAKSSVPLTAPQAIAKFGDLKWKLMDNKDAAAKAIYRKRHTEFYTLYRKNDRVFIRPKEIKRVAASEAIVN